MKISHNLLRINDVNLIRDRVYDAIKGEILSLKFPPNMQLVEQELSESIGVSKSPIRDAFVRLEAEGFVFSVPYRGCFVAGMSFRALLEIFQLREAIEVYALEKTLADYTNEDLLSLRNVIAEAIAKNISHSELDTYTHHLQFHYLIVQKLQNITMKNLHRNTQEKLIRYVHFFKGKHSDEHTRNDQYRNLVEHFDIIESIAAKDTDQAAAKLRHHLSNISKYKMNGEDLKLFEDAGNRE